MKAIIKKKTYDTDNSTKLGSKCVGEFGQPNGYEEQLCVTKDGNYFFYGVGGPDSPYAEPTIKPATKKEAEAWKKDNNIE